MPNGPHWPERASQQVLVQVLLVQVLLVQSMTVQQALLMAIGTTELDEHPHGLHETDGPVPPLLEHSSCEQRQDE